MGSNSLKPGDVISCGRDEFRDLRRTLKKEGYEISCRMKDQTARSKGYLIRILGKSEGIREGAPEDKAKIIEMLLPVLQQTRAGGDLTDLTYSKEEEEEVETVKARYEHGGMVSSVYVDVTGDSGIAMIKDVLRRIK